MLPSFIQGHEAGRSPDLNPNTPSLMMLWSLRVAAVAEDAGDEDGDDDAVAVATATTAAAQIMQPSLILLI